MKTILPAVPVSGGEKCGKALYSLNFEYSIQLAKLIRKAGLQEEEILQGYNNPAVNFRQFTVLGYSPEQHKGVGIALGWLREDNS